MVCTVGEGCSQKQTQNQSKNIFFILLALGKVSEAHLIIIIDVLHVQLCQLFIYTFPKLCKTSDWYDCQKHTYLFLINPVTNINTCDSALSNIQVTTSCNKIIANRLLVYLSI
jgi:hypothetical protein